MSYCPGQKLLSGDTGYRVYLFGLIVSVKLPSITSEQFVPGLLAVMEYVPANVMFPKLKGLAPPATVHELLPFESV